MFDAETIYDEPFLLFYTNIIRVTCILTFILNVFLITAIIKKTPKFMQNVKIYLIPYAGYILINEFAFTLYTPILFHPKLYIYPVGIAKVLPRNISFLILGCIVWAGIGFLNCSFAMALERFFALKNIHLIAKQASKGPFYLFIVTTALSYAGLAAGIGLICFKDVNETIFVSSNEIENILNINFRNLHNFIDFQKVLIFRGAEDNLFLPIFFFIGAIFFVLVSLSLNITILNLKKLYSIKQQLSYRTFKNNTMLLKMAYLQLFGIFLIFSFPVFGIAFVYYQLPYPCFQINYFLVYMNLYELYDIIVTILCIKPYRLYFISFFKKPKSVILINSFR